tara:strand:- start:4596 stop:5861 length:1266 start_codon:yes stop_codon:yes gene_type:complete
LIRSAKVETWVLFLYLIAPYGVGVSFIPGVDSFDLVKFSVLSLILISVYNYRYIRLDTICKSLLLFSGLYVISFIYSENYLRSSTDIIWFILTAIPGFFITYVLIRGNEKNIISLFKLIDIAFLGLSTFALLEFLLQYNFFDQYRIYTSDSRFNNQLGTIRTGYKASMGNHASTLPFAYTLTSLFFLRLFLISNKNKTYLMLSSAVGVLAIICTFSRAAILTLIIVSVFYLLLEKKNKILVLCFSVLMIAIVTMSVPKFIDSNVIENYIEKYINPLSALEKTSADSRLNNNITDLKFGLEKPIFGRGAGALYHNKTTADFTLDSSDSSYYITTFVDRGLMSLSVLLYVTIITFRNGFRLIRNSKSNHNYLALICSFFAVFICINGSQRIELLFIFFLLVGLINQFYYFNKLRNVFHNNSHL